MKQPLECIAYMFACIKGGTLFRLKEQKRVPSEAKIHLLCYRIQFRISQRTFRRHLLALFLETTKSHSLWESRYSTLWTFETRCLNYLVRFGLQTRVPPLPANWQGLFSSPSPPPGKDIQLISFPPPPTNLTSRPLSEHRKSLADIIVALF